MSTNHQLVLEIASASVAALPAVICEWCREPMAPRRGRRYCSGKCRAASYDQAHPRLAAPAELGQERQGSIQARIEALLADGLQRTAAEIAYELREGADTVAREARKLARKQPRLRRVARGGHERAVWFLVAA